ncbi:hypothetical protein [Rothia mucilaginosa]|nr:hypothetical protein [Rothia mucilaginosa]
MGDIDLIEGSLRLFIRHIEVAEKNFKLFSVGVIASCRLQWRGFHLGKP